MNILLASMPGGSQILVIGFLILLLFGGSKLPALARGLGQSVKEFKKGAREDDDVVAKKPEITQVETNTKR